MPGVGGTALLLATVVGSGIMGERLAGGNLAVALLVLAIAKKRGKMVKTSAGGRSARGDLRSVEDIEPNQPAAVSEVMCDLCDASARSAGW